MNNQPELTIQTDGGKEWWVNGERHREDGPAIEYPNGSKEWWVHGKRHRLDGPAVECPNGYKVWYFHGHLHRENGPAVELADGGKEWWVNGERHREDGPAIEGTKFCWFLSGVEINLNWITNPNLNKKYPKLINSMIIHLVHET